MKLPELNLVETLLGDWQRWTCHHQWVRARFEDGSYGLRCSLCMKAYAHTWDEVIGPVRLPEGERCRRAA